LTLSNVDSSLPEIKIKPAGGWELPSLVEVWRLRELIFIMVKSNLNARYRQSLLSVLYIFLQPLFSVGIFTFIFSSLAKIETDVPYPLFSFVGVITWNLFNRSLNDGNASLVSMSAILSKVYMPRLVVVFVSLVTQLFEFFVAFSLVFVFMVYFKIYPNANILFFPLAVLGICSFSFSIVLWISNLNVRYRDISVLLPGVVQVMFYATPVLYPLTLVPEKWKWFFLLNPMTNFIELMRYSLFAKQNFPDVMFLSLNIISVLVLTFFGLIIFNRYSKTLVDRL
jgi:lipopolysaccharide transport system permease protein